MCAVDKEVGVASPERDAALPRPGDQEQAAIRLQP